MGGLRYRNITNSFTRLPEIHPHALARFIERSGKQYPEHTAKMKIYTLLANAREYCLKKRFRVKALLTHNIKPARYFMNRKFMMVIQDGVIVTIHTAQANRWTVKKPETIGYTTEKLP